MARQHTTPLLLTDDGAAAVPLAPLALAGGSPSVSEAFIQNLVQEHPSCLPISEIDPLFAAPVPVCTELNTPAGPIDNFMVTASGLPVLIECKLWRNPEGRREVVGQILDYAKELSRWSSSDIQREASRRLGRGGNVLLDLVRQAGHDVDEADFNDALTGNLRRGRFLLLIVGDGIREGVEAISEYLQIHAGLHFTLGLVELPIYAMPDGGRIVVPRVLARSRNLVRTVVAAPEGMRVLDGDHEVDAADSELGELDRKPFWTEFLTGLSLDDPEQKMANATNQGAIYFPLPAPGGTAWLTVFRTIAKWEVGLFLSYTRGSEGERVVMRILEDWESVRTELGGTVRCYEDKGGRKAAGPPRTLIQDDFRTGAWTDAAEKARALGWLRTRTNEFLNVLRPRVRAAAADLSLESR
ncbi:MAG TPA: hypothetical protein VGB79_14580 [Allosphingosinicella sp.]